MEQLAFTFEPKPAPIVFEDENPVQRLRTLAAMKAIENEMRMAADRDCA